MVPGELAVQLPLSLHWPHALADWHWLLGTFIATLAAVISNLGLNLQKLAHLEIMYKYPLERDGELPAKQHMPYFYNARWLSGIALIILGSIADFAALGFAAQSLVATLGSLTLVSNIMIAPVLLKESVSAHDVRGTVLILAGCSVTVLFGQHTSQIHTLKHLLSMFQTPAMLVYTFGVLISIGILHRTICNIENEHARRESDGTVQYTYAKYSKAHHVHRFVYPAMSGIVGAQSVLFGKCLAEILKSSLVHGSQALYSFPTWGIMLAMITTILVQIWVLNKGLKLFDALFVVPIFQTVWLMISVIGGLVFFNELQHLTSAQAALFLFGVVMTLMGMYELSKRQSSSQARRIHHHQSPGYTARQAGNNGREESGRRNFEKSEEDMEDSTDEEGGAQSLLIPQP